MKVRRSELFRQRVGIPVKRTWAW